ncbi:MAG: hypothetical protein GF364_19260 [Candidatus Lokiarchaeota archaeon]|nr:hypothetical protein [Candidatus Lokiarchaeota archaeon]
MELEHRIENFLNNAERYEELAEQLNALKPILHNVTLINEKVEACARGELTYPELAVWLKENF